SVLATAFGLPSLSSSAPGIVKSRFGWPRNRPERVKPRSNVIDSTSSSGSFALGSAFGGVALASFAFAFSAAPLLAAAAPAGGDGGGAGAGAAATAPTTAPA